MIVLISGASHTGKTVLAQKLLEQYHYPYLSIDHLKMGLIRSGQTQLTPCDDAELTDYLWPILREMIKTAIVVKDESKDDEVGINKTVELYFEDDDEVEEFKIVTTVRGNSLKNLVSTESPIGKALLGHKVGDRVWIEINANAGYFVEIKSIRAAAPDEEEQLRKF